MSEKIYLGIGGKYDEKLWIEKHRFDCGWYWAFGYIGNRNLHMHISSMIEHPEQYNQKWTDVDFQFSSTWLSQEQWWILRDLFIQAYALKSAAETYKYGGHQTGKAKPYQIISEKMNEFINNNLEELLDNIWLLLTEWREASKK